MVLSSIWRNLPCCFPENDTYQQEVMSLKINNPYMSEEEHDFAVIGDLPPVLWTVLLIDNFPLPRLRHEWIWPRRNSLRLMRSRTEFDIAVSYLPATQDEITRVGSIYFEGREHLIWEKLNNRALGRGHFYTWSRRPEREKQWPSLVHSYHLLSKHFCAKKRTCSPVCALSMWGISFLWGWCFDFFKGPNRQHLLLTMLKEDQANSWRSD